MRNTYLIVEQSVVSVLILAVMGFGFRHLLKNFQMQINCRPMFWFYLISVTALAVLLVDIWLCTSKPLNI